mmetsp:Transcript_19626/g.63994  ORF Transcript_19626/g.63994 Transcript_19626/m.63994 type:complete len:254 (-) Transcript_19626:34-795(-)
MPSTAKVPPLSFLTMVHSTRARPSRRGTFLNSGGAFAYLSPAGTKRASTLLTRSAAVAWAAKALSRESRSWGEPAAPVSARMAAMGSSAALSSPSKASTSSLTGPGAPAAIFDPSPSSVCALTTSEPAARMRFARRSSLMASTACCTLRASAFLVADPIAPPMGRPLRSSDSGSLFTRLPADVAASLGFAARAASGSATSGAPRALKATAALATRFRSGAAAFRRGCAVGACGTLSAAAVARNRSVAARRAIA